MASYWITFRNAKRAAGNRSYDERYEGLIEAIRANCIGSYSDESTSFLAFESIQGIGALATIFAREIEEAYDLFLIRAMDTKSAIACGAIEDEAIFSLTPYADRR